MGTSILVQFLGSPNYDPRANTARQRIWTGPLNNARDLKNIYLKKSLH